MISNKCMGVDFYYNIVQSFLSMHFYAQHIMILEAISFELEEIETLTKVKGSKNLISDTYVAFEYKGYKVLNMFKDETGTKLVNPIDYYGFEVVRDSFLVKYVKYISDKMFNSKFESMDNLREVAARVIGDIQEFVYKDYVKGMISFLHNGRRIINPYKDEQGNDFNPKTIDYFNSSNFMTILDYHYCKNSYIDNYEFSLKTLSNKDKKYLIKHLLEESKKSSLSTHCYTTYYIYRYNGDKEMLRVSILKLLEYSQRSSFGFLDNKKWDNLSCKISFEESLFKFFKFLYVQDKNNRLCTTLPQRLFREEILTNSHMKNAFFESLEVLLCNEINDNTINQIKFIAKY